MSAKRLTLDFAWVRDGFALRLEEELELEGCTAVFGPSGAGKSTLLRLIAGLERPDSGCIAYDGAVWAETETGRFTPAHQRGAGAVFQDGRLFPHLSVEQNLAYAFKRRAGDPGSASKAVSIEDAVEAFDLSALLARRPETLSGGERQRVALARTILSGPKLLLLDEPLSALDRARKAEILPYLDDLPERFGAPVIYVSHTVWEVVRLAQRTLILRDGEAVMSGPTAEVLNAIGAHDDATPIGAVLEGRVVRHDEAYQLTTLDLGDAEIALPLNRSKAQGDLVNIRVDARDVALALEEPTGLSIRNTLKLTITKLDAQANTPFVLVSVSGSRCTLVAQITRASMDDLGLATGQDVFALIKSARFDP